MKWVCGGGLCVWCPCCSSSDAAMKHTDTVEVSPPRGNEATVTPDGDGGGDNNQTADGGVISMDNPTQREADSRYAGAF